MLPREILKFSFSKTHIWYGENVHARDSRYQMSRLTTASLLKLCFCSLFKQKMDMDISSDSSSSDEDTVIEAYWESNVGLPFTDPGVSEEEF